MQAARASPARSVLKSIFRPDWREPPQSSLRRHQPHSPRGDTDELVKGDPPIHQRIRGRSPRDADRHRRARILRAAIHRQGIERLPSVDSVASKAHSLRTTIGPRRRVMNVSVLLAGWPFATLLVLYGQYAGHAPLCGVVRGKTIGAKPWSWREMGRPTRYRLSLRPRFVAWMATRYVLTKFSSEITSRSCNRISAQSGLPTERCLSPHLARCPPVNSPRVTGAHVSPAPPRAWSRSTSPPGTCSTQCGYSAGSCG